MPEDVPAEERIPALLAERSAIAFQPEAAKRQAEIDDQLRALGYEGELGPSAVETADEAPKRRGRPPAGE